MDVYTKMTVYSGNLREDACSHAMMIVNCLPGQLAAKWEAVEGSRLSSELYLP